MKGNYSTGGTNMIELADDELKTYLIDNLKPIEVDVIANPDGDGVDWELAIKSHGNDEEIDLPRDSGGYEIEFRLIDRTRLKLRFDASAPIFASTDVSQCPTTLDTSQIMVDECDDNELDIVDWNYGSETKIRYQLNFVDKVGNKMPPFDPIIRNGGGVPPRINR
jgi:hypothetical protein